VTFLLTAFTLVAFAANSILCRMALMTHVIGPVEFTVVRLLSGTLILLPLAVFGRGIQAGSAVAAVEKPRLSFEWRSILPAVCLFSYALFFSLAYVKLQVSVGALILFPSVQITMIGLSIILGNRVSRMEWFGLALAFAGLVYLLLPGLSAPPLDGTIMMMIAGSSWGVYSILGRNQPRPIHTTARNFLYCLPGCLLLIVILLAVGGGAGPVHMQANGLLLAVLSGAVASAIGYVLWYVSLRRITTTAAAISQLAVPVIAALGGILFLHENLTLRLVLASILIFSGITVTVLGKRNDSRRAA
jgi:drug/metabolite transporter (DMT)-like permease